MRVIALIDPGLFTCCRLGSTIAGRVESMGSALGSSLTAQVGGFEWWCKLVFLQPFELVISFWLFCLRASRRMAAAQLQNVL